MNLLENINLFKYKYIFYNPDYGHIKANQQN